MHYGKVNILSFFNLVEPEQAVSAAAAKRIPLKGLCKICGRPIKASHRVKSNFICHVRRAHPEAYAEYEMLLGRSRSATFSVASLDEGNGMVGTIDYSEPPSADVSMHTAAPSMVPLLPLRIPQVSDNKQMPEALFPASVAPLPALTQPSLSATSTLPQPQIPPTLSTALLLPQPSTPLPVATSTPSNKLAIKAETLSGPADSDGDLAAATSAGNANGPVGVSTQLFRAEQKTFEKTLVEFLAAYSLPISVVETPQFKNLVSAAKSCFVHVPSVKGICEKMKVEASDCKASIKEILATVKHFYLSEETRSCHGRTYVCLSVHYIHKWAPRRLRVFCKKVECFGGGVYQLDTLAVFRSEFGDLPHNDVFCNLSGKLSLPGFKSCINLENECFGWTEIEGKYWSCFTYELGNSIVCSLLHSSQTQLLTVLRKCSKILAMMRVGETSSWYEQVNSLTQLLEVDGSGDAVEVLDKDSLTQSEQTELRRFLDAVKPMRDVVKHFQRAGATTSTSSLVVPYRRLLMQTYAESPVSDDQSFVHVLSQQFLQKTEFVESGNKRPTIYTTATSLDPRFKLQWCDDAYFDMYKEHLLALAKAKPAQKAESAGAPSSNATLSVFAKILKQTSQSNEDLVVNSEVMRYLQEPIVSEESDVLTYWQQNQQHLPTLSALAQRYLAIPTSSADLELSLSACLKDSVEVELAENMMMLQSKSKLDL